VYQKGNRDAHKGKLVSIRPSVRRSHDRELVLVHGPTRGHSTVYGPMSSKRRGKSRPRTLYRPRRGKECNSSGATAERATSGTGNALTGRHDAPCCRAAAGSLERAILYHETTGQVRVGLCEARETGLGADGYVGSWQSSQAEAGPAGQMARYGATGDRSFVNPYFHSLLHEFDHHQTLG
jgi:hypothetical protein